MYYCVEVLVNDKLPEYNPIYTFDLDDKDRMLDCLFMNLENNYKATVSIEYDDEDKGKE